MATRQHSRRGFTLIELMVVIVVIAILAAITIVSYNSIMARARDAQRMSDVDNIVKALEIYRINHGEFPTEDPNPGVATSLGRVWESSVDSGFLSSLDEVTGGARFKAPGDQKNYTNVYWYHTFAAGTFGCDSSDGPFAVILVLGMETQSNPVQKVGPCTGNSQTPDGPGDYAVWLFG